MLDLSTTVDVSTRVSQQYVTGFENRKSYNLAVALMWGHPYSDLTCQLKIFWYSWDLMVGILWFVENIDSFAFLR